MNRKQFLILLVLVAVVGGAGLIIHQRGNQSWQNAGAGLGQKLLPNLAINNITQINIQSGTNALRLIRLDDLWRVSERGGYPADFNKISDLLLKLSGLKVVQTEEISPSQLGRLNLLPPGPGANTATLIEFKEQSGKTLDSLLLGKPNMQPPPANSKFGEMADQGWPNGRYVMASAGSKTVNVIADPLDAVQPQPEQWLNKDFLSIEKPRMIGVKFPEATNSWTLTRASETNDWQLADVGQNEKLDTSKLYGVISPFGSASFNDVAPLPAGNPANVAVLTVDTFDGFTYVADIGAMQGNDYPVTFKVSANLPAARAPARNEKSADKARLDQAFNTEHDKLAAKLAREEQFEDWVFDLPSYSVEEFLKKRGELLAESKKETPSSPAK